MTQFDIQPDHADAPRLHQFIANKHLPIRRIFFRLLSLLIVVTGSVLVHGFYSPPLPDWGLDALGSMSHLFKESDEQIYIILTRIVQFIILTGYWFDVIRVAVKRSHANDRRMSWIDFVFIAATILGIVLHLAGNHIGWPILEFTTIVLTATELWRLNSALARKLKRPALLLPLSFFALIAIGTPLLKLPLATPIDNPISWLDALFTMTSAVCVTGLAVRNTAVEFTPFGQTIIAIFIQLGGLGIIIFASMFALLLGRSFSIKENISLSQMLSDQPMHKITSFVRFIVITTIAIESIGALLMLPMWTPPPGSAIGSYTLTQRFGMSFFHAISAFCNAGFDITGDSFFYYRSSSGIYLVIIPLIILGGLGFPVLGNLYSIIRHKIKHKPFVLTRFAELPPVDLSPRRLTLHSKIVLTTTATLLILGTLTITISEIIPYLSETPNTPTESFSITRLGQIILDSSFMSVSARTAGFYSAPTETLQTPAHLILMALMLVGGSPASTAGGVKTTIIALLFLSIIANMRQRPEVESYKRTISATAIQKAGTIFFCYIGMILTATYLLTLTEKFSFIEIFFEVVSAATTTGLSLGITQELTPYAKIIIIAVMFLGRVGPLALLSALVFSRKRQIIYKYPHEEVVLG